MQQCNISRFPWIVIRFQVGNYGFVSQREDGFTSTEFQCQLRGAYLSCDDLGILLFLYQLIIRFIGDRNVEEFALFICFVLIGYLLGSGGSSQNLRIQFA